MVKKQCRNCHETKLSSEFYFSKLGEMIQPCKQCCKKRRQLFAIKHPGYFANRNHQLGVNRPMDTTRDCTNYLGVHVAERALSKFFDHIKRMPINNPGYDFICGKGFKIDVKSSCLHIHDSHVNDNWIFHIERNQIADYFLCIGFDNRTDLNPMHVWLIPGNVINMKTGISITNTTRALNRLCKYEHPIDKVSACCNQMRDG